MSLRGKIRGLFSSSGKKFSYSKEEIQDIKTQVATGGKISNTWSSLFSRGNRTPQRLEEYWKVYSGDGTVFSALNSTAWNVCMTGYTLESDDKEALEQVRQFLSTIDFDGIIFDNVLYAFIFGDSFIEIIYNKKKVPVNLKTVDPKTMFIEFNEKGIIDYYYQEINGKKLPPIKEEKIIQIGFYPIPGTPYHLSLLEPSWDTIKRKVDCDDALSAFFERHATRKWHVIVSTVGDLGVKGERIPKESELKAIATKIEELSGKNEIVTSDLIEIKALDTKGVEKIQEYYNYFLTQLVIGLMCPEEALGYGKGSTEASAYVTQLNYDRMIKAYQLKLSKILETKLFDKITRKPGAVRIRFKGTTDVDETKKSEWISRIIEGIAKLISAYGRDVASEKLPLSKQEVRLILRELLSSLFPPKSVVLDKLLENDRED